MIEENSVNQANIMVVDDQPANLRLLEDMLGQQGYQVSSFPLGRLALRAAAHDAPELILLDINMPEMNGYEVCEKLKSDDALSHIPVIFLSALNEPEDKLKGFRSGAVDYISKPFQLEEVQARVKTHVKLHVLQRVLRLQNEHLEETVAARTSELADANTRLTMIDRSKSDFLNLISHELRTPLNGLLGVGDLVLDQLSTTPEDEELRGLFDISRRRILSMLDNALLMTEIDVSGDNFRSAPVPLSVVLAKAIEDTRELADARRVNLQPPPVSSDLVLGDRDLLVRALHALLKTAVKFCGEGKAVCLTHKLVLGSSTIIIESEGKTIPAAMIPKFFDLFSMGEEGTPGGDLGLDPPVASRILSLFGGSVSVENRNPSGIRLTVSLRG